MQYVITFQLSVLLLLVAASCPALADDKNPEDPTKIVSKVGVGYSEQFTFSGSIGLGEIRKINGTINEDGKEWRLGGSWLFDFGIVNFKVSRNEYDHGANANSYSIGTFIPLSHLGFAPGGLQIFPMAGYNETDGEFATTTCDVDDSGVILIPQTSQGAYLGAFALKPINHSLTLISFAGGAKGSSDYSSYSYGMGVSWRITQQQSLRFVGSFTDNDYGTSETINVSYTYEFN